jgi:putative transposase
MCATLGVSRAAYYAWVTRSPSAQRQHRELLLVVIRFIHDEVRQRYGSPRMFRELRARGYACRLNTVAGLMRANGLAARGRRKYRCTTDSNHRFPVAENLLDRPFEPGAINRSWVADMTFIPTLEGWLYLAAVEDLGSRMIVGWSMAETMTSRLVVDALEMGWERRHPGEGLLTHTDRGSQYAREHDRQRLSEKGIRCSMSRRGNCWDNAPMESFFASLKKVLVHDARYLTRAEARASLFEYIEVFYNRVRLHSSLEYRSPAEYEKSL